MEGRDSVVVIARGGLLDRCLSSIPVQYGDGEVGGETWSAQLIREVYWETSQSGKSAINVISSHIHPWIKVTKVRTIYIYK
jgi:hypothetical protein